MRLFYVRNEITKERIIAAGKDYHITWGVWSYINDKDFIAQIKSLGWQYQGTLNGGTLKPEYALLGRGGQRLGTTEKNFWADPSKAGYREEYLQIAKKWIDNGATSLQRDDPPFGEWNWRKKRDLIPDDELVEFHSWARREIEKYAGRKITMSTNSGEDRPFMKCFDYRMTEVRFDHMTPSYLLQVARKARKQGMLFVVTGQQERPVEEFRLAWAGAYATGSLFVVPWDQFNVKQVYDKNAKRIFIDPNELADLTGFVRANARYLNGYEDAAVGGYDLQDSRYGSEAPVTIEGGSGKLSGFIRAQPGETMAPVVVHLVEWGKATPAVIQMRRDLFFGEHPVKIQLRLPAAYDKESHTRAEITNNYQSLAREITLTPTIRGNRIRVSVPAMEPWGILVVTGKE
jgi:hypothetical protein